MRGTSAQSLLSKIGDPLRGGMRDSSFLGILASWAKWNLVYDPFCHNAIRAKVLAAGAASSLVLSTNRPTTDLAYRP